MKISKRQLRRIIREEYSSLNESADRKYQMAQGLLDQTVNQLVRFSKIEGAGYLESLLEVASTRGDTLMVQLIQAAREREKQVG